MASKKTPENSTNLENLDETLAKIEKYATDEEPEVAPEDAPFDPDDVDELVYVKDQLEFSISQSREIIDNIDEMRKATEIVFNDIAPLFSQTVINKQEKAMAGRMCIEMAELLNKLIQKQKDALKDEVFSQKMMKEEIARLEKERSE